MSSLPSYLWRSVRDLTRTYLIYRPTRLFNLFGALFLVPGAVLALRYLFLASQGMGKGHVQSVIASGVLAVCGVFMISIGVVAQLLGINRRLLEELRYLGRSARTGKGAGQGAAQETRTESVREAG